MNDEISKDGPQTDLLGDPIDQKDELLGRPPFEITKEKQELVAALRASKWTHERIARYLGCDAKTLRNHFSRELDQASDIIEGMAIETILKKAKDGNVSAARRMQDIAEGGRALPPGAGLPAKPQQTAAKEPEAEDADPLKGLGKKDIQKHHAQHPGKSWAALLPSGKGDQVH